MRFITLAIFSLIAFPALAQANDGPWIEWMSHNIQVLHGHGFELTEDTQTTFTFEHADSWKYGDNFFYVDYSPDASRDINAEFSPRLSFGKMTGADLSVGPIKDFLLAGTWEKARDFDAFLYGAGIDLEIPGFNFFQINLYCRDNTEEDGHGWQTTWVWSRPFSIGTLNFTFDGYFDYADYEEGEKNFFTQPQLLLDVGDALNITEPGKIYAGVEYRYWNNKFGIEGVNESVPQAMIKWAF